MEEQERADGEEGGADDGDDPWDRRCGSPSEPEEGYLEDAGNLWVSQDKDKEYEWDALVRRSSRPMPRAAALLGRSL